jgi:hypothetical protein
MVMGRLIFVSAVLGAICGTLAVGKRAAVAGLLLERAGVIAS